MPFREHIFTAFLCTSHQNVLHFHRFLAICRLTAVFIRRGNEIAALDESVLVPLQGLKVLMLEDNLLRSLPRSIGKLKELRELAIYGNELESLPAELGRCCSLTKIEAWHNRLEQLPVGCHRHRPASAVIRRVH